MTGNSSDCRFDSAHRFLWPPPMRFRAAALIFRRLSFATSGVAAGAVLEPDSEARSSAISVSMRRFCSSKPKMAAVIDLVGEFCGHEFLSVSASPTLTHSGNSIVAANPAGLPFQKFAEGVLFQPIRLFCSGVRPSLYLRTTMSPPV